MRAVRAPQARAGREVAEPQAQRDDHRGAGGRGEGGAEGACKAARERRGLARDAMPKAVH